MKLRLYTTAWGSYLELLNSGAIPSVWHSIESLKSEGWQVKHDLYTTCDDMDKKARSDGLCKNFIQTLKNCIDNDEYLFLLMPDTIFGAESLYNIVKYGYGQDAYIALPHLRFNVGAVDYNKLPLSNYQLVKEVWPYPHQTTATSYIDDQPNSCLVRCMLQRHGNIVTLNHYYPTIYFFKPKHEDVENWENRRPGWGWLHYDNNFLKYAVNTNRVRIIGSSDFAFCAELEEKERHNAQLEYQGRNMPEVIQFRDYAPKLFNTAYTIRL